MYIALSAIVIATAICLAYFTFKLLDKAQCFLAWLRGMFGLCLILSVVFLGIIAFDISSYRQLTAEQDIATIRFEKLAEQHYLANVIFSGQPGKTYELFGDQWQLDSRVIKWSTAATKLGIKTGYRLDRLAGRYLSLDDERTKTRKLYALNESPVGVDTWLWLNEVDTLVSFVDARYGSGVFLPMVDQGFYQITLSSSGLVARPINNAAKEAVKLWQ